jgi:hypothetical protein
MRFWFDTEFYEDGKTIELISIGIVAEDGQEYYAETAGGYHLSGRSEWLEQNVRPHLRGGLATKARSNIAREIVDFVGEKPEFWAYYADYDWVALCQLYGRMIDLPDGWPMFCRDLKQLAVMCGDPKFPKQDSALHNALADARWAKEAWQWLLDRDKALRAAS